MGEHPTAAEILFVVHEIRTNTLSFKEVDQGSFESEFNAMPEYLGLPEKPPSDFIDNVRWANEQLLKMRSKAN